MCGISRYLSLFETLSEYNLFDISKVFDFLPKNGPGKEFNKNALDLKKAASSCRKQDVRDVLFQPPTGLIFKTVEQKELF